MINIGHLCALSRYLLLLRTIKTVAISATNTTSDNMTGSRTLKLPMELLSVILFEVMSLLFWE